MGCHLLTGVGPASRRFPFRHSLLAWGWCCHFSRKARCVEEGLDSPETLPLFAYLVQVPAFRLALGRDGEPLYSFRLLSPGAGLRLA